MKKKIVISGISLFTGGPLSVLMDILAFLNEDERITSKYEVIAFVHNKDLFPFENIKFLEFPKARRSYLVRLFYEYFYFYILSIRIKPYLWFSVHDITPHVKSEIRAVYCHNPSPFYPTGSKDFKLDKGFYFFTKFYKYLYKINIKKNNYVVVQQEWIRQEFHRMFNVQSVVAYPEIRTSVEEKTGKDSRQGPYTFFYPAFPRIFKNFEVLLKASELLEKEGEPFQVIITINGAENKYASMIFQAYSHLKNVKFLGQIPREKVMQQYAESDCLVFPSKLETWGLPITEMRQFGKPILVTDLPYAKETAANYPYVSFFKPDSAEELKEQMKAAIYHRLKYADTRKMQPEAPFCNSWKGLFDILLKAE